MPAKLMQPYFVRPDYEPLDVLRLREESDALDYEEQVEQTLAWEARQARLALALKDLARAVLALAAVGAVVVGLWLAKAWG